MEHTTNKIGRYTVDQESINVKIDFSGVVDIFLKNEKLINKLLKKNQKKEIHNLWKYFFKNKIFNFPINKSQEIFIKYNKDNLERVFNYINFRYLFYLSGHNKINIGYPPYLLIEPVSSCNLRCPFCFQTDKSFTRKPYMGIIEFDLFKKVVDEADVIGVGAITLASRGEPTLHKKFKEMLKYVGNKKNIFEVKLNTNATNLTEDIAHEIFKNKISQVVISGDHYEKETFEKLRKNSNFEKIVENVDRLFSIKKQYPDSFTEIRISGINMYKNLDKKKFYDFWIKRSDHVTVGDALERWDTYNNSVHDDLVDPC